MSKTHTIITIGRQFGSGGREIGKRLADELGIEFYDKELLSRAAKDSKICKELFETHDEKPTNSFLYSLVMDTYSMGFASGSVNEMPLNHKIFLAQFDAIKKIAEEGPCVLVGRCADYALEERDDVLSVFIHADMDKRIAAVMARDHINSRLKAKRKIEEIDEKRSTFRKEFTGEEWGQSKYYNLSIDTTHLSYQQAADLILYYKKLAEEAQK